MFLSEEAVRAIKENGELFGKIADHLKVAPLTLGDKLRRKDQSFTQIGVINLIKKYTELTESEIITINETNQIEA